MPIGPTREQHLSMILALLAGFGGALIGVAIFVHLLIVGHHGHGLSVAHAQPQLDATGRVELLMMVGAMLASAWGWWTVRGHARVQAFERAWALHRARE